MPSRRTSSSGSGLYFSSPTAEELYPPVQLNVRDLESFRRSTVTRSLIRDIHVEQHRIRDIGIRGDGSKRDELRGRLEGIEWVLSMLEGYYRGGGDDDTSSTAMTVEIDEEL